MLQNQVGRRLTLSSLALTGGGAEILDRLLNLRLPWRFEGRFALGLRSPRLRELSFFHFV